MELQNFPSYPPFPRAHPRIGHIREYPLVYSKIPAVIIFSLSIVEACGKSGMQREPNKGKSLRKGANFLHLPLRSRKRKEGEKKVLSTQLRRSYPTLLWVRPQVSKTSKKRAS